jgi:hypothetical protein
MVLSGPATALVLFDSVVSILVIDLSGLVTAKNLVCLSYLNKLLICCLVSPSVRQLCSSQLSSQLSPSALEHCGRLGRTGSYRGETSC